LDSNISQQDEHSSYIELMTYGSLDKPKSTHSPPIEKVFKNLSIQFNNLQVHSCNANEQMSWTDRVEQILKNQEDSSQIKK
jgi:hypothetical protein